MMPRRKNDDRHWFLCDSTHGLYAAFLALAETRHKTEWPDNNLSVVLNDAGTQALVKVSASDTSWQSRELPVGLTVDQYDKRDHSRAVTLLRGAAWSKTRSE